MYFSTVPPSFSMSWRSWLKAAPSAALSRSGPRRTVCCVEPTTSMKRQATSRRSSRWSTESLPSLIGCLRLTPPVLVSPRRDRTKEELPIPTLVHLIRPENDQHDERDVHDLRGTKPRSREDPQRDREEH